jgi:hypothetical protein
MIRRLRSRDDVLHRSAFFELLLHALLIRQGFTIVEIEPRAVAELALILHHPAPARTTGPSGSADPFGAMAALIEAKRAFHAVLILLTLAQLTGWLLLARSLAFTAPW